MAERLADIARLVRKEVAVYRRVMADPRTPRRARWLLGAAVAYVVMPVDVIPDFIPGIGHLDDAVVVPAIVRAALKSIPPEVVADARAAVTEQS